MVVLVSRNRIVKDRLPGIYDFRDSISFSRIRLSFRLNKARNERSEREISLGRTIFLGDFSLVSNEIEKTTWFFSEKI